jgi:hypothetical protein
MRSKGLLVRARYHCTLMGGGLPLAKVIFTWNSDEVQGRSCETVTLMSML